jgi:hypothetical protein
MPDHPAMTTFSDAPELRKLAPETLLKPNSYKKMVFTHRMRAQTAIFFIAPETKHQVA